MQLKRDGRLGEVAIFWEDDGFTQTQCSRNAQEAIRGAHTLEVELLDTDTMMSVDCNAHATLPTESAMYATGIILFFEYEPSLKEEWRPLSRLQDIRTRAWTVVRDPMAIVMSQAR